MFNVPFKSEDFIKLPQGTSKVLTQGEKLPVRWKDNNIVTVAINMEGKFSTSCQGPTLHFLCCASLVAVYFSIVTSLLYIIPYLITGLGYIRILMTAWKKFG